MEGEEVRNSTLLLALLLTLPAAGFVRGADSASPAKKAAGEAPPVKPVTGASQTGSEGAVPKGETGRAVEALPGGTLFDGKELGGWKQTPFGGGAEASVENGELIVESGEELSGVHYTRPVERMNYEISLEAQRRSGLDFFCGLTFPVGPKHLTFVVGGWGGSTVGISSVDKLDASLNETSKIRYFKDNQWYRIRVRVEPERIQAWIDQEQLVDLNTKGRELDLRPGEIEISVPLGIATFRTTAPFRNIRMQPLTAQGVR